MQGDQTEKFAESSHEDMEEEIRMDEETPQSTDVLDETEKLIEVWKVLNTLTVSLDRLGMYWHFHGEEAAKEALHQFMNPLMFQRIARARSLIIDVLIEQDPVIDERLEQMTENENEMGYWDGPK